MCVCINIYMECLNVLTVMTMPVNILRGQVGQIREAVIVFTLKILTVK